ncbi:MAG: hypothetical protein ABSD11_19840 [Methylocella sp.]
MKFLLRTLAATALLVLAANVCFAATAARSSLISKKQEAAIRLAHPQAPRGGRHNNVPRNGAARTATAADAQKAGTGTGAGVGAVAGAGTGVGAGTAAVSTRNASIVSATAAIPAVPALALRAPVFSVKPPPVAAVHDAVISGIGVKHATSTLAALGGAATGSKGTAVVNGTNVRPKKH